MTDAEKLAEIERMLAWHDKEMRQTRYKDEKATIREYTIRRIRASLRAKE